MILSESPRQASLEEEEIIVISKEDEEVIDTFRDIERMINTTTSFDDVSRERESSEKKESA
ncbi:unnamed protein product [Arabis nemorensis]|uniref:Uncharacterized protein n=1 Tax=Arabis nemorensis TaxID=586526 RepID=A0A565AR22_9BRAS|nr:unnamed protein product [Arabis nemorensis]